MVMLLILNDDINCNGRKRVPGEYKKRLGLFGLIPGHGGVRRRVELPPNFND